MFESTEHSESIQNFFASPQNLQHLRDNVKTLIEHDISSLENLLDLVQKSFQSGEKDREELSKEDQKQKQSFLFSYLSEQNRERSGNLSTLAHLSMKMIDFILEEQQRTHYISQQYLKQIDHLKNTIDILHRQNSMITQDIEVFKDHLESAQGQINNLIEEKEYQSSHWVQKSKEIEEIKDRKIQHLERELEKLKENLTNYKHQHQLKKSQSRSNVKAILKKNLSEARLFQTHRKKSTDIQHNHQAELKYYIQINKKLILDNEKLKNQISTIKAKSQFQGRKYQTDNKIKVQISTSNTAQQLSEPTGFKKMEHFTSLKTVKSTNSIHSIKQNKGGKFEDVAKFQHESQIRQSPKILSEDISKKSFELNFNCQSVQKLHFLNDDEDSFNINNTYAFFGQNNEKVNHTDFWHGRGAYQSMIIQTNETQNSIKSGNRQIFERKKVDYKKIHYQKQANRSRILSGGKDCLNQSMISNGNFTERSNVSTSQERSPVLSNQIVSKIAENSFFKAISNFVVKNRIKRNSFKASIPIQ